MNEQLIRDIRDYILQKTGKLYFRSIKYTPKNIMVSCPYHKGGQERKPSCGIKIYTDEKGVVGQLHCFTCGKRTNLKTAIRDILGEDYDKDEIEAKFGLETMGIADSFNREINDIVDTQLFKLPDDIFEDKEVLKAYRGKYHNYLASRNIWKKTAELYDIGYDEYNDQITFPIYNIHRQCLGIGRRSIKEKRYLYPAGMVKPLYGVYELFLPRPINYLWVVEGPFNLWTLKQYGIFGVALLGTGTDTQYEELLKIPCRHYMLALDGDDAGRKSVIKLGEFLKQHKKKVMIAGVPDNEDINSMSYMQFNTMPVGTLNDFKKYYKNLII